MGWGDGLDFALFSFGLVILVARWREKEKNEKRELPFRVQCTIARRTNLERMTRTTEPSSCAEDWRSSARRAEKKPITHAGAGRGRE